MQIVFFSFWFSQWQAFYTETELIIDLCNSKFQQQILNWFNFSNKVLLVFLWYNFFSSNLNTNIPDYYFTHHLFRLAAIFLLQHFFLCIYLNLVRFYHSFRHEIFINKINYAGSSVYLGTENKFSIDTRPSIFVWLEKRKRRRSG